MKRALWLGCLLMMLALCAGGLAEETLPLRYGSTGDAVIMLQERLTELGYYTFRITGNYQEHTQQAVRDFQAALGWEQTGIADEALLVQVYRLDAPPVPPPAPTSPPAAEAPLLQFGSVGDDVLRVQLRLQELGYYAIEVSGNYLGNTRNAVRDFQRKNGLQADGVVGQATWDMLFFGDALDAAATPRPTPSPTPVPYRIGVDVTNQVTTVYGLDENQQYTDVVRQMLCSTGTTSDPTPLDTFVLNGRTSEWCYFPQWGTHARYWTRINASIAFHSVIYAEPDLMALKTGSYTGLGKRASHGCIRLMVDDAKWIYDNCGKGTEVVIYEGEEDEELTRSLKIPPLDRSVMMPEPTAAPTQPPAYSADALPPMPFTTLERGVESEAVYWLQCKLTELGYYHGSITGGYYGGTVEACKAYQRDNGLSVDGKAGKLTLSRLYEDVLATPSPSPTPAPAATRAPDASPSPSAAPLPSGADPTPDAAPEKTSGMRLFVTVAPLP